MKNQPRLGVTKEGYCYELTPQELRQLKFDLALDQFKTFLEANKYDFKIQGNGTWEGEQLIITINK